MTNSAAWPSDVALSDHMSPMRCLQGAELFDNACFGMSQGEARAADPQQRLVLEEAYSACAQAGLSKSALVGRGAGVFLGIMNTDFAELTRGNDSVYAVTGGEIDWRLGLPP